MIQQFLKIKMEYYYSIYFIYGCPHIYGKVYCKYNQLELLQ